MSFKSKIYDDNDGMSREARFDELTKQVIQILHPLLNPTISTPEQARIDYFNNAKFNCACQSIVRFIISEKPDAEECLKQAIEIDDIIRRTNLFLK